MDDGDHADKERRGIIERYDRGREEGAKIDDWEDPELPLYHTTDRYGFIQYIFHQLYYSIKIS